MPRPEQSLPAPPSPPPGPPRTSAPVGHSMREQSGPREPRSQRQPTSFKASHGAEYVMPASDAKAFWVMHTPRPEQSLGHTVRSHAMPS
eukprot:scaffold40_cov305-Pinguiococcus_pyrenoidosus.AAC.17